MDIINRKYHNNLVNMIIEILLHQQQEVGKVIILQHNSTAAVGLIAPRISRIKLQTEVHFQLWVHRLRIIITIQLMLLPITYKVQFSLKITWKQQLNPQKYPHNQPFPTLNNLSNIRLSSKSPKKGCHQLKHQRRIQLTINTQNQRTA